MHVHVLMRDEKEGKQARSNKAKQHSTPNTCSIIELMTHSIHTETEAVDHERDEEVDVNLFVPAKRLGRERERESKAVSLSKIVSDSFRTKKHYYYCKHSAHT